MKTMAISRYQKIFGVGPLGLACSLLLFVFLSLLDRVLNHVAIADHPWLLKRVGYLLIGIWICWHIWCLSTLRAWLHRDRLCVSGPYRGVRHPLYFGAIFGAGIGIALIFNSWILLLLPLLMYPVWSLLVRREEKLMTSIFGEEYKAYADRTGRLFPKFF